MGSVQLTVIVITSDSNKDEKFKEEKKIDNLKNIRIQTQRFLLHLI